MRSNLDSNDRLVPPRSLHAAEERLRQLEHHIPILKKRGVDANAYFLEKEREQLAAWIASAKANVANERVSCEEFWK